MNAANPIPFTTPQGVTFTRSRLVVVPASEHHGNLEGVVESVTLANGESGGHYARWFSDIPAENDRNGLYSEGQCGPDGL